MGWCYFNKPYDQSVKEWFVSGLSEKLEVLDSAIVKIRTLYAAVKVKETGEVFACVYLLDYNRADGFDFGYKPMDETFGPVQSECPERILKLLTPTDSQYANEWRARCWENINRRKNKPKLKHGDIIRFKNSIKFTNGRTLEIFQLHIENRKTRFLSLGGGWYNITKWRDMEFEVVTREQVQV